MTDQIPESLGEFDRITTSVPMVSAFQAMWNDVEESLHGVRAEGFTPEDIGRLAFNRLPEQEKEEALEGLFYAYWVVTMADRETHAARDEEAAS